MKMKGYFITLIAAGIAVAMLAACDLSVTSPTAHPASPSQTKAIITAPLPTATPTIAKLATATLAVPTSIVILTPTLVPSSTQPPAPTEPVAVSLPPTPVLGPAIPHIPVGRKINIVYIHMIDPNLGWGIGNLPQSSDHIFRTKDGGNTWQDVTPPQPDPAANIQLRASGAFQDAASAWVVFSQDAPGSPAQPVLIWYTHDGGSSWKYGMLDTSNNLFEFFSASDLVFEDGQHGWLLAHVGAGMMHDYVSIAATTDGGITWQFLLSPTSDNYNLACFKNGMAFVDAKTGWLAVDCNGVDPQPYLYRTSDGGSTWQELDIPAPSGTPDFFDNYSCGMHYPTVFSTTSAIFAMRCLDNATYKVDQDYLYRTNDGGNTWQTYPFPAGFTMTDTGGGLYFANDQAGLAFSRKIYKTNDGGQNWSLINQVYWDGQFDFLDIDTGWAAASNSGQYALVKTTNGGKTLNLLNPVVGP
jgi:photosystem II stability/assembly factor-like uncharacterized protein